MLHIANRLAFLACLSYVLPASGHYLWLGENSKGDAVVTFGEVAGAPGPYMFLSMVAGKINLSSHDTSGQHDITLSANETGNSPHSELVGSVNAKPPYSLRLAATFGLFHGGSLLQYWCSADVVTKPDDWGVVQDWVSEKGLEITIRDPYMNNSSPVFANAVTEHLNLTFPYDECKPPYQNGFVCVFAVVRFNGNLLGAVVNIETFAADGKKINTTTSQSGVTILKVPYQPDLPFTAVWARVNYHENVPGKYNGTDYKFVDHWATTYARIVRKPSPTPALLMV